MAAVETVRGKPPAKAEELAPKRIRFSGYEWEIRQVPSDSGGVMHANSAANIRIDAAGALHLRITQESGAWVCAELYMLRSLGYGTYSFKVKPTPRFDPATVFGMFLWDDLEGGQNHREIDIELSQWGDPAVKNAQFVVQPNYIPANSFRFKAPASALTHSFRWEPGIVTFRTAEGSRTVAEHAFTSGIPTPGGEAVHINLYVYGKARTPQQHGAEVVIEKFEYLP
ncbi:MAG: glycoside hydrolase family 16 protein [Acidobacteriia bacterium]|nr:glycoside hydrolase family 16 protein [Terriglobia bacterium]